MDIASLLINAIIWACMAGSAGCALLALWLIYEHRLIRKFPVLSAFLLTSSIGTLILLWTGLQGPPFAHYAERWAVIGKVALGMHVLVCLEMFARIGAHFKNFRWFGTVLALAIAALATGLAWISTAVNTAEWLHHTKAALTRVMRWESLACLIFIGLTVGFFSQFRRIEIRENVKRHIVILGSMFACLFLGRVIIETGGGKYWYVFAHQMVVILGPTVCCIAWARSLTSDGEKLTERRDRQKQSDPERSFSATV